LCVGADQLLDVSALFPAETDHSLVNLARMTEIGPPDI
jgi:hypothetical protein